MENKESPKSANPKKTASLPWWASILVAIGSYCSLKYVVPQLHFTDPTWQKLSQAAPSFAPLITIPFLLLAAKQLYDSDTGQEENNTPQNSQEEDQKE